MGISLEDKEAPKRSAESAHTYPPENNVQPFRTRVPETCGLKEGELLCADIIFIRFKTNAADSPKGPSL